VIILFKHLLLLYYLLDPFKRRCYEQVCGIFAGTKASRSWELGALAVSSSQETRPRDAKQFNSR